MQVNVGLRRAFKYFDVNDDGLITPAELQTGLSCLNELSNTQGGRTFSTTQVATIVAHLDRNRDGMIDYHDFLDGFRISFSLDHDALLPQSALDSRDSSA